MGFELRGKDKKLTLQDLLDSMGLRLAERADGSRVVTKASALDAAVGYDRELADSGYVASKIPLTPAELEAKASDISGYAFFDGSLRPLVFDGLVSSDDEARQRLEGVSVQGHDNLLSAARDCVKVLYVRAVLRRVKALSENASTLKDYVQSYTSAAIERMDKGLLGAHEAFGVAQKCLRAMAKSGMKFLDVLYTGD